MLIRRLGILCYLQLPSSKVIAVFKELVHLLMLWFLQRRSPNAFYQFSFLQTTTKREQVFTLIYDTNPVQTSKWTLLFSVPKQNMVKWSWAGLATEDLQRAPWCVPGKRPGRKVKEQRDLLAEWASSARRGCVRTLPPSQCWHRVRQRRGSFAIFLLPTPANRPYCWASEVASYIPQDFKIGSLFAFLLLNMHFSMGPFPPQ